MPKTKSAAKAGAVTFDWKWDKNQPLECEGRGEGWAQWEQWAVSTLSTMILRHRDRLSGPRLLGFRSPAPIYLSTLFFGHVYHFFCFGTMGRLYLPYLP